MRKTVCSLGWISVLYTSDLEGEYVATLKGVDTEGKKIELEWEFQVK